ncbi:MAG TPA: ABC transporter permease [Vicinamibacterales bacterium]|nr:ABC transporter permease [Vicinamibacterales bacterium]
MLEALRSDVRYALKWLIRSPAFTAVAILSLAVGIGFNTTIFSVVDALLLRPLPVERPDRLVDVYTRGGDGDMYATSSYPDYLDFKSRNEVFTDMLGYSPSIAALKAGDRSRMALGEVVTGNYFPLLGVPAAIGRTLLPEDDRPGAGRAVVLSHGLWTREYGADASVLGKPLHIHGQPYTIVGVAPAWFTGMVPMLEPEMWTAVAWVEEIGPAGIQDAVPSPGNTRLERRGQRWMFVKGRLKDGETAARAEANLQLIMGQLGSEYPKTNERRPIAVAGGVRIHPQADRMLWPIAAGLMIGIGLVLLVACANVANMLLARASGRRREIGIRLAIGASRMRLVRQLVTESLVLAALGAAAGVGIAALLLRLLDAMPLPLPVPLALALRIDGRVLLFTTAVASLAGLVAGLAPALRATRPDVVSDLKGDAASAKTAGRRWTLRDGLVALQTAVTLVLLVSAALLTRSILEAQRVDLGFRQNGLVALGAELSLIGYDEPQSRQLFERAYDRIRAIPGVQSVSRAVRQPLAINYNRNTVFFPERQQPGDRGLSISATWVDENYFATLGVPLLSGRNFGSADGPESPRVAIVNEAFVRTYWLDAEPLGRRFRLRGIDGPEYEVVGVSADYKVHTVGEPPTPYIHYALGQRSFTGEVFIARTAVDPDALLASMRSELLALEPGTVFLDSQTLQAQVDTTLLPARLAAQTIGLVGLVATALAAIGLYGVIAYAVARRTREIGIRMALGAAPGSVMGMVMRQGLSVAAAGLLVGAGLSWLAARAIASGLYGVGVGDPAAWAGAAAILLAAAALANYVPARRAARVDPSVALRLY